MIPNKSWQDKNIAEQIIKLYQTEELVRSFDFDIELIDKHVLAHLPVAESERLEVKQQYQQIIDSMRAEGLDSNKGHLKNTQALVDQLNAFHITKLGSDPDYQNAFAQARASIRRFSELRKDPSVTPIQICLDAVFGLLLLRLNGKKIDPADEKALEPIGEFLSILSFKYEKEKAS